MMMNGSAMNPTGNLDLPPLAAGDVPVHLWHSISLPAANWKQVSILQEASVDERNA
jgi:hypothetical protein